ncbi:ABC transporter permease [Mesorhizobium sp. BAC0120]|uniref:ABC transporter permease n=1 Tax=Mesorhizobium sp. BAC0120 TaxID=3090670 RepID=UPI00298CA90F|nr:ABC transporter permease [Mesorhizobium sp. BAC0120]MDW6021133.1 ABC transporter permease [Mesorhizobium sp. BAC0120]
MRADATLLRSWLALALVPLVLFAIFYVVPVVQLFWLSLSRFDPAVGIIPAVDPGYFFTFLTDSYYLGILGRTVAISVATTIATAILAYPLAIYLLISKGWRQTGLLIVLVLPLVTSSIVVSYGWLILLGPRGLVNDVAMNLGLTSTPLQLMYTDTGIVIGLTHVLLVFMALSIAASMQAIDANLWKAARSLGATSWTTFRKVTFPLTLPGLRTGCLLVFSLSMSAYATPVLIGGPRRKVLSYLIYQQSSGLLNWPFAAAMAVILLASTLGIVAAVRLYTHTRRSATLRRAGAA